MFKEISFILGAVIGPGIFVLPFNIAKYESSGILSLIFSSCFFLILGNYLRKYGSPFTLIEKMLGKKISIIIGWTYWTISWLSSIVVINEISICICTLLPILSEFKSIFEILLLLLLTLINFFGIRNSLKIELCLSILKIVPLIVIPIIFLIYGKGFIPLSINKNQVLKGILPTIWCFAGLETISFILTSRKSFLTTMLLTTFIYLLNLTSVYSFYGSFNVGPQIYAETMQIIAGNTGALIIRLIVIIESVSNLNTWILSSGLSAYELAKQKIMPNFLTDLNAYDTPSKAIFSSITPLFLLIFLMRNKKSANIIIGFTNVSCSFFLIFYSCFLLSCYLQEKTSLLFILFLVSLIICISQFF